LRAGCERLRQLFDQQRPRQCLVDLVGSEDAHEVLGGWRMSAVVPITQVDRYRAGS